MDTDKKEQGAGGDNSYYEWDRAVETGTWQFDTAQIEESIINATLMEDENLFIEAAKKEQREQAVEQVAKKLEDVRGNVDEADKARIRQEVNRKIIIQSEELKNKQSAKTKKKKSNAEPVSPAGSIVSTVTQGTGPKKEPSEFRKRSSDWREDNRGGGFGGGSGRISWLQWAIAVLAVAILISGIQTTAVYAKYQGEQRRALALAALTEYPDDVSEDILSDVLQEELPELAEEPEEEELKVLSLVLTSVEKDLKIKLIDQDETLVKGIPWGVTVTNEKGDEEQDEDEDSDGIIHLTDMPAGEYTVEITPSDSLSGYQLPSDKLSCSVKASVEYKVIANIKDEIKSEKEVNAAAEDASRNQAADVETGPVNTDTVEWCESTKTDNGEIYVEAIVDLTKTASLEKKDGPLIAFVKKLEQARNTIFSRRSILASPIFLTDTTPADSTGEAKADTTTQDSNTEEAKTDEVKKDGEAAKEEEKKSEDSSKSETENTSTQTTNTDTSEKGTDSSGTDSNTSGTNSETSGTATNTDTSSTNTDSGTTTDSSSDTSKKTEEISLGLKGTTTIPVGTSTTITATITPSSSTAEVIWDSSDTGIATVVYDSTARTCTVTGVAEGTATIRASAGGTTAGIEVTVTKEQKYADTAQLYDADKNALYVKENDDYRLAKYADYIKDSTQKFYKKIASYLYTGWQTIDGCTYYYQSDHNYVTGDQIIQGVKYHFDDNGVLAQGSGTLGIDVSKYQPSINWSSVKASGVNFVIIRCGYRGASTGVLIQDPYYVSHVKGAKAAGLKVGVYFFSTALNEAEAVEEASMCAALAAGYGINYPIFIDVESSPRAGYNGLSVEQRTANITAFCKTIRSAGYSAGVYANKNWFSEKINAGALSGYKIWLAQYNSAGPTYTGHYDLWQYTSKGSVDGISGYVDMDQSYLGY